MMEIDDDDNGDDDSDSDDAIAALEYMNVLYYLSPSLSFLVDVD